MRIFSCFLALCMFISCESEDKNQIYSNVNFHAVSSYPQIDSAKVKNIILLIGDGMGPAQISAARMLNKNALFITSMPIVGTSETSSTSNYITDSAAGATAFSTGKKTYNGAIAVDDNKVGLKTILEMAEDKGMVTGLIATSSITHATPASFAAHQPSRKMNKEIAADIAKSGVDVIIGGGEKYFSQESIEMMKGEGVRFSNTLDSVDSSVARVACFLAKKHLPKAPERKHTLADMTSKGIDFLASKDKGFFLMVEGSQIDWGGHANDFAYVVKETLDFDQAVGRALAFAAQDRETLVIVTADHETGGLTLVKGDVAQSRVEAKFSTDYHTGIMVPVHAYGPQSNSLQGTYPNTHIFDAMKAALGL